MPLIRDTIDPTNEREVPDEEALDLERMGLLLTGTRAQTPGGLRAAAVRQIGEDDEATGPTAAIGVGAPSDSQDDTTDPGDAPDSTTDNTPDNTQES